MARLDVEAAGSPLFKNFLFVVSVSDGEGQPVTDLGKGHFEIHHQASLNHASDKKRVVSKATEGPAGFYRVQLEDDKVQPDLPPGRYVFAVMVKKPDRPAGTTHRGQTLAVAKLPA